MDKAQPSTEHVWLCTECGVRINSLFKRLCRQCEYSNLKDEDWSEADIDELGGLDESDEWDDELDESDELDEAPEGAVWDSYHGWYLE